MTSLAPGWQFWIDRGGTFTDIIGQAPDGTLTTHKLLSVNPDRYDDAVVAGVRAVLGVADDAVIDAGVISAIKMGTTVATNALLEHRGEPTVLLTNTGFGDALRIGYQHRPQLFARHIVLPAPLYAEVVEVTGRMDAQGIECVPLDLTAARRALEKSFATGLRACAIVLMHGYRNPQHEQALAAVARDVGMTQVSASHAVSPLIRFVSRGETTVVDSYLSPVLRRYVNALQQPLRGTPVWFMQSHGGLTRAEQFSGKDSILSGPAGGIVGAVESCRRAGFHRIISFDMGGTSTDVALFGGEYERVEECDIAGVHVRVPMLAIHTVASGGGSVACFESGRYQVGPASSGADPGPACYRRGGPLTVTDCNAVLGRLQPQLFPAVLGPNASQSLDVEASRRALANVHAAISAETADGRSLEATAWGFLQIAVDNMANAIKDVSLKRGHDVSDYTLCSFGGAGGQHACAVADALGMEYIYVPPLASLLSAYGMGLASVRVVEEASLDITLDAAAIQVMAEAIERVKERAIVRLRAQRTAVNDASVVTRIFVSYRGQDAALPVMWADLSDMHAAYTQAHRQRFGFEMPQHACVVNRVQVEMSAAPPEGIAPREPAVGEPSVQTVLLYDGQQFVSVNAYAQATLRLDDVVVGPALIHEAHATTVVEAGWQARADALGGLVLQRATPRPKQLAVGTHADPVLLEIFNNLFMAIAEQMGAILAATALSVNIKERLDFSCAIFDSIGALVANAPHVPVHLGSMGDSVAAIVAQHGERLSPGDSYATNAPYRGGTHLPDITVVTPVFDEAGATLLFFVACRGHHADVGGITPGSMPAHSRHIDEEGTLFDGFLLVERGVLRDAAFCAALLQGAFPARNVAQNLGDIKAQVAANAAGVRALRAMVQRYSLAVVHAYMQHVQDNAEAAVRRVIDVLHDGAFSCEMDDGSIIAVSVRIDKEARSATIDFTGTSSIRPNNFNAPRAICTAVVLYVFRTLVDAAIPLNAGCLKPLHIRVPEGSMLNPTYPAAVVAGNVETSQCMADALFAALGALAGSQGTMNNFTFGTQAYQYYETVCGGAGAGPDFAGASAVHTHMTNSRLTDPEVLESRFPIRLESFAVRRGSGGAGRQPGGEGVIRTLRFLEPMAVSLLGNRRRIAPHGLAGGGPGACGRTTWVHADGREQNVPGTAQLDVKADDVLIIETPGGGAFG